MSWADEKLTERFYAWEVRGRGWQLFNYPVLPEPPFREFDGHYLPPAEIEDDGRRHTGLSRFAHSVRFGDLDDARPSEFEEPQEREPIPFSRSDLTEIVVTLSPDADVRRETFEEFLFNLSSCEEPIAFEVIASAAAITVQFATGSSDAVILKRFLQSYFPEAVVTLKDNQLAEMWRSTSQREASIVEFGLEQEFMLPLVSRRTDFVLALTGALSELDNNELAVFQVLFQPVQWPWAQSTLRSVTDDDGKPFFSNRPELLTGAKAKIARPLYAAVLRIAAVAESFDRRTAILRCVSRVIASLLEPTGNNVAVQNSDDYSYEDQEEDFLRRQSRRTGMLLNSDELLLFVNLPSSNIQTPKLLRQTTKTRPAPASLVQSEGFELGENVHGGQTAMVRLTREQRVRHVHVIGASGTGKSTLLLNLIRQDIESGEGVALLDPHGDLADAVLGIIPSARVDDVVVVDPSDDTHSVGFNILNATSDLERTLLASDLISVFQRLSTSWGDQMNSVLQNAILAFLESDHGGTLADLRRFLLEPAFRNDFLRSVRDSEVVYYWQKAFHQLSGNKSIGPILTRLETFLSPKPIRLMVSQAKNRLDFAEIMDSGKIFIAKLAQGLIGRENAYLLGSLFVAKLQQTAMARQNLPQELRRDFWLYIDEVHNFVTASMAEILAGARKYRLGLTLAHQELRQLHRNDDVASAVLSNAFTRIVFRVGDSDARALAEGFSHFDSNDLRNLDTGRAVCRVERSDNDFNFAVPLPQSRTHLIEIAPREQVIAGSRARYAMPRPEVEAMLAASTPPAPKVETSPAHAQPSGTTVAQQPVVPPPPPTVTVTTETPAPAATESQPVERRAPRPLGKGGEQHKRLQLMVKQWAQGMGYRATIEEKLASGGQVDVSLHKPQRMIACEISITTPNVNEIENVRKCIEAGYHFVTIISPDPKRVAGLERAISSKFAKIDQSKLRFFATPEDLFMFIEELDAKDVNREETVHGYKVRVRHQVVDKTSKAEKNQMLAKIVANVLKRKRTSSRQQLDDIE